MCTRHSDCSSSLNSLASNRNYCCGGSFCCTLQQYNQGLTSDPFLSSTGALVGIVVGIMVFCLVVGGVVWCWFKNSKTKNRIRKQRARQLEMASYPGPYTDDTLPGYSTNPRPLPSRPVEYDYPPSMSEARSPREPRDYRYKKPGRHFDDIQPPDYEHARSLRRQEERVYHNSPPARHARRYQRNHYRTDLVEYLPHHKKHSSRHHDDRDHRRQDRR